MRRIKSRETRTMEERERQAAMARALRESEPSEVRKLGSVSVHVFDDGKAPRLPAIGLHPGAIDGTTPHRHPGVLRFSRHPDGGPE